MSDIPEVDEFAILVNQIIYGSASNDEMARELAALEPAIEAAYALGLTQVKPVSLMTADDLVS